MDAIDRKQLKLATLYANGMTIAHSSPDEISSHLEWTKLDRRADHLP